jgi:hypothetical protein
MTRTGWAATRRGAGRAWAATRRTGGAARDWIRRTAPRVGRAIARAAGVAALAVAAAAGAVWHALDRGARATSRTVAGAGRGLAGVARRPRRRAGSEGARDAASMAAMASVAGHHALPPGPTRDSSRSDHDLVEAAPVGGHGARDGGPAGEGRGTDDDGAPTIPDPDGDDTGDDEDGTGDPTGNGDDDRDGVLVGAVHATRPTGALDDGPGVGAPGSVGQPPPDAGGDADRSDHAAATAVMSHASAARPAGDVVVLDDDTVALPAEAWEAAPAATRSPSTAPVQDDPAIGPASTASPVARRRREPGRRPRPEGVVVPLRVPFRNRLRAAAGLMVMVVVLGTAAAAVIGGLAIAAAAALGTL